MTPISRGLVVDVDLNPTRGSETGKVRPCVVVTNDVYNRRVPVAQVVPITAWNARKARIVTNVSLAPSPSNGLTKPSVADCLQTRPVDVHQRLVRVRGELAPAEMTRMDEALRQVFGLRSG